MSVNTKNLELVIKMARLIAEVLPPGVLNTVSGGVDVGAAQAELDVMAERAKRAEAERDSLAARLKDLEAALKEADDLLPYEDDYWISSSDARASASVIGVSAPAVRQAWMRSNWPSKPSLDGAKSAIDAAIRAIPKE